jgi:hypothetical protein
VIGPESVAFAMPATTRLDRAVNGSDSRLYAPVRLVMVWDDPAELDEIRRSLRGES